MKKIAMIVEKIVSRIKHDYLHNYALTIVPSTSKKPFHFRVKKLYAHLLVGLILVIGIYSLMITATHVFFKAHLESSKASTEELIRQKEEQSEYMTTLEENKTEMDATLSEINKLEAHLKKILDID